MTLRVGDWIQLGPAATEVRMEVFVKEQHISPDIEIDENDPHCVHVVKLVGNIPVGTARLLPDGRVGRMCVLKSYRRLGIGSELIQALCEEARKRKFTELYLHSQVYAVPFYEKNEFSIRQEENTIFMEEGIPHVTMYRNV